MLTLVIKEQILTVVNWVTGKWDVDDDRHH